MVVVDRGCQGFEGLRGYADGARAEGRVRGSRGVRAHLYLGFMVHT